jgi:carboxymethylenebutenolidase
MTQLSQIPRPDGQACPAYVARPGGAFRGGIVVIQEWWGLNEQIKGTADRLAAAGYVALVPDLYRGKVATTADEANHRMGELNFMDAAEQDVRGAALHLKAEGCAAVGVVGFCMGGALTIIAAMKVPEMDAGVCFYGVPPEAAGDLGTIRIPLQCHFAEDDDWCTPAVVDAFERRLRAGGVAHELYRYDAKHAFMNEKRPEVYDAGAAAVAWDRALQFFAKNVG